jgi:hypothetical protein
MDYRQVKGWITFLLPDGRQDCDPLELDFQRGLRRLALVVAHVYVMQAFDAGLFHLGCNRMTAVARQPIDAGADKEVSAKLLRQAIQFVDVAFAVANMNATPWLSEPLDRLPEIVDCRASERFPSSR